MNQYILTLSWANTMKQKSTKGPGKFSVAQKTEPETRRSLHQKEDNISLIFVRFFFSPINLIFEFNLVLIFLAQVIYLFYFLIIIWYSTGLEVHPAPPQFFLSEPVKLCWGSMFFSFESLQLQNVLIVFLFTMKPVMYLLWNECTC